MSDLKLIDENGRIKVKTMFNIIMNDATLYHLVSAIRGPDFSASNLKYLFTSRIRYFLEAEISSGILVRDEPFIPCRWIMFAITELKQWIKKSPSGCYHYLNHIKDALYSLNILGFITRKEFKLLLNLTNIFQFIVTYKGFSDPDYLKTVDEEAEICRREVNKIIESDFIDGKKEVKELLLEEIRNVKRSVKRKFAKEGIK